MNRQTIIRRTYNRLWTDKGGTSHLVKCALQSIMDSEVDLVDACNELVALTDTLHKELMTDMERELADVTG